MIGLLLASLLAASEKCAPDCEVLPAVESQASAERRRLPEGAIDIDVAEVVASAPLMDVAEVFASVPGVVARARQNYAQDTQISVRGYGARSAFGVRSVRFTADGIPATAADGQTQVGQFDALGLARIQAVVGPFAALYGNGGAAIDLRSARRQRSALRWFVGSGGRDQAALSLALDDAWFRVQRVDSAGARAQSAAERTLFSAGYRYAFESGEWNFAADRQLQPDSLDPQGLTRAEFERNPRAASPLALAFNTRKSVYQNQLSARYAHAGAIGWEAGAYFNDRDVEQMLSVNPVAQQAPTSGGGAIDLQRRGVGGFWRAEAATAFADWQLQLRRESLDERRLGFENFVGSTLGVRGDLRRDERNRALTHDAMVRADRELGAFGISAGVRRTWLDYDSDDSFIRPGNPDDSGEYRASAWLPVAGLSYRRGAWQSALAAGRALDVPTLAELAYRPDGDGGFNTDLRPSSVRQAEWSLTWRRPNVEGSAALFTVHGAREIVVQSNEGGRSTFANAGKTRRRGADLDLRWRVAKRQSLSASLTYTDARFVEGFLTCGRTPCPTPDLRVPEGAALPGVPRWFGELGWRWQAADDLTLGAQLSGASDTSVSERSRDRTPGYGVLDVHLQRELRVSGTPARVVFRIDNLFDKTYSASAIVNEAARRYFEPAPGRTFWIGIDWTLPTPGG